MLKERHTALIAVATLLLAAPLCGSVSQAATVYKSVDAEGRVTYSDQPPSEGDVVEVMDLEVQARDPSEVENDLARIEAMRETTDRMAADRRERETARAKARAEAEAARAASYPPANYYPNDYYGGYGGSVSTSSRYSYSGWRGGIYIGDGAIRPRPPYGRPPYHRPPHARPPHHRPPHGRPPNVRPPFRPGYDRQEAAQPGFSYNAPANQIRRRYTGKAREVFYGR